VESRPVSFFRAPSLFSVGGAERSLRERESSAVVANPLEAETLV
jgi:hypothetical protein